MSVITFMVVVVIAAGGALLAAMGGLGVAIAFWVTAAAVAVALTKAARGATYRASP